MSPMTKPWHGILVATALPMRPDARSATRHAVA